MSGLLSRTSSSLAGTLTALLPSLSGRLSRTSSDSGFHSRRASSISSRRSSVLSLASDEEDFDKEDMEPPLVTVYPGGDVEDNYELRELLGEGAFSKVYLAESRTEKGGLAAVKVINKEELCREDDKMFLVDKEIEIMSQLDHSNIVRLYEVYENKQEVCLVMELAKGGELFDRLLEQGSLGEEEAARLFTQLLEAVAELHSRGIVHRDLKPENLLFYDNRAHSHILLADFGLSDYEEELTSDSPVAGTPTYLAPEVIGQTNSSSAQDLWSCGVILFILLCGYPPFYSAEEGDSETGVLKAVVKGRYTFHPAFWDQVSAEAKDLVTRLLCLDPRLRLTASEALRHPWILRHQSRRHLSETLQQVASQVATLLLVAGLVFGLYFLLLSDHFGVRPHLERRAGDIAASCHDVGLRVVQSLDLEVVNFVRDSVNWG